MTFLFIFYFLYLILYAAVSYAVIFHLRRYRIPGDKSNIVIVLYVGASIATILGSLAFLQTA